ncbi:hypothetical protein [Actinomadura madurae]|uniref:hypothetical protein n=1 Tax=Actinomadura madurae TaxID=1993 RepID=UPI0020D25B85|nr:hypothetical protein [Actinomadura madurae]MCP9968364.1 hypothetical protein [Actinomadura madurae]MCQ0007672.1 hypothetical protein [Actinomadura madurae]MCQ0017022.1 hypothetical protein [Actinomadura madurae]
MTENAENLRLILQAARSARPTDRRTPCRPEHHHALRPGPQQPRPPPNYILAAYMTSGT